MVKNKNMLDIIIPTLYNTKSYLQYTLKTIQNNKKFEDTRVLVWCNGYTIEDYNTLCKEYNGDPHIIFFFSKENIGQAKPVNMLSQFNSKSVFIMVLNDDMVLPKNF